MEQNNIGKTQQTTGLSVAIITLTCMHWLIVILAYVEMLGGPGGIVVYAVLIGLCIATVICMILDIIKYHKNKGHESKPLFVISMIAAISVIVYPIIEQAISYYELSMLLME